MLKFGGGAESPCMNFSDSALALLALCIKSAWECTLSFQQPSNSTLNP